ncbi:MAG: alpha-N-arabinofuranosidase [Lachnospiraceae bacterium]|nr:alpha-N-arabinofuranosidase [Lachnospiraceae bacterium]
MKLTINRNKKLGTINPDIYGHFSEHLGRGIYEGLFVGEDSNIPNTDGIRNDVVEALRDLSVPVLRWPGGCFADEYHWMDGIGPKEKRKKMVNTSWGGVTEDNSFGTHEFMRLCELLGCKTYINGNLGTGSPKEMSEWVEYMTGTGSSPMTEWRKENGREEPWKVDYFAVGNESWGCGGNMRAGYYADLYRHYQTFIRNYDPKNPIKKICVGPGTTETDWTKEVLSACYEGTQRAFHGFMDYLTLHYYVFPNGWTYKGEAVEFTDEEWYKSLNKALYIETVIRKNEAVLDDFDPEGKIALCIDEWGGWYEVEKGTNPGFLYQQNTMRDALIASTSLDIFNRHCKRVQMACIAQMVNVLQSVILTQGPKMVKTPTYYVFHLYKHHQGAEELDSFLTGDVQEGPKEWKIPQVSASASEKDGVVTVTASNLSLTEAVPVSLDLCGETVGTVKQARIVTADQVRDYNDFGKEEKVTEKDFTEYVLEDGKISVTLPPHSVIMLRFC